jgi:hypothetical protein
MKTMTPREKLIFETLGHLFQQVAELNDSLVSMGELLDSHLSGLTVIEKTMMRDYINGKTAAAARARRCASRLKAHGQ